MPLRTTEWDIAAICLVPPGNIARELAAFKRRLFRATGDALSLAFPETAVLLAAPWAPGLDSRDGRRRTRAVLGSAWPYMEGQFRPGRPALASGWLVLPMEGLPPILLERASAALGEGKPSSDVPFPLLPSFPLFPVRDSTGDLAAVEGASPPALAFGVADLALFRFRVSEGRRALAWTSIVSVRRRRGRRTAGGL
jgi:hypothetical protein